MSNSVKKKQVSVSPHLIEKASKHKLFKPGKKGGEGVVGMVDLALSFALNKENAAALEEYQNSFKIESLKAEQKAIAEQIKTLQGPAPKKAAPKKAPAK